MNKAMTLILRWDLVTHNCKHTPSQEPPSVLSVLWLNLGVAVCGQRNLKYRLYAFCSHCFTFHSNASPPAQRLHR
jgi:hypothetical protein